MTPTDRKQFFGLLRLLNEEKDEVVHLITKGRTTSSSDMTQREINRAIGMLKSYADDRFGKSRRKVIHLCAMCGMVDDKGIPDYKRIDNWVAKQKKVNPKGRVLFWLRAGELNKIVGVAEAMYKNELRRDINPEIA